MSLLWAPKRIPANRIRDWDLSIKFSGKLLAGRLIFRWTVSIYRHDCRTSILSMSLPNIPIVRISWFPNGFPLPNRPVMLTWPYLPKTDGNRLPEGKRARWRFNFPAWVTICCTFRCTMPTVRRVPRIIPSGWGRMAFAGFSIRKLHRSNWCLRGSQKIRRFT